MIISLILKDIVKNNEFSKEKIMEIINQVKSYNIKRLIIAPIYYGEESKSSIEEVERIVDDLNLYLNEEKIDLKLYPANLIRDNFYSLEDFINGTIGNIRDTEYALLNVEETENIKELEEIIYEFKLRNYNPILVGIEKMKEIIDDSKKVEKLYNEGCLFQLDICSLRGDYGKKIKKTAKILKKNNIYSFVGFENSIKKEYLCSYIKEVSKKSLMVLNGAGSGKVSSNHKKKIYRFI